MKPRPRTREPKDGRADRTVQAPQLVWGLLGVILILAFMVSAWLFSRA